MLIEWSRWLSQAIPENSKGNYTEKFQPLCYILKIILLNSIACNETYQSRVEIPQKLSSLKFIISFIKTIKTFK